MEYENGYWPATEKAGEEKAEEFSRKLYDLEIPSKQTWFDKLDCKISCARKTQKHMTLEDFFSIERSSWSTQSFIVGRTNTLRSENISEIVWSWRMSPENENVEFFYWFVCNYKDGFEKVANVFKEVYRISIEKYPRIS